MVRPISTILAAVIWVLLSLPAVAQVDGTTAPRVGLALSGGGARGAAHIGVLRQLEAAGVQVDYIAGTSIGAIIGALHSVGYGVDEIESIVLGIGFSDALEDDAPRRYRSVRRKQLDEDLLMDFELGIDSGGVALPLGAVQGQRLAAALREALLPAAGIQDFDRLPIPFRAVAADLETGEAVVIGNGDLVTAVRASLSIPGVFIPVEWDDRLLVDGGVANNLPVDVVRSMGADVVIAVDISTPLFEREQLTSLVSVTEQLTTFLTRRNVEAQIAALQPGDILIVPQLGTIGTTSFSDMPTAIQAGEVAALEQMETLQALASAPRARSGILDQARPVISFLDIDNQSRYSDGLIRARLDIDLDQPLDMDMVNRSIDEIYGLDLFQQVSYQVVSRDDRTGLLITAVEKDWGPNYLQFGLELTDDFSSTSDFNLGAAYTMTGLNPRAGELRIAGQIGRDAGLEADYYQPLNYAADWFVASRAYYLDQTFNVFEAERKIGEVSVAGPGISLGIGRNFSAADWLRLDLERREGDVDVEIGDISEAPDDVDISELRLSYRYDTFDSIDFPTEGQRLNTNIRHGIGMGGGDQRYDQFILDYSTAWSISRDTFSGRITLGYTDDDDAPVQRQFRLGGFGRLSGLQPDQLTGQQLGLATLAYYHRLNDVDFFPAYAGLSLEVGNVWPDWDAVSTSDLIFGGSLFVGADTILGPVYLSYGRADTGDDSFYLFLGNPFQLRWLDNL